MFIPGCGRLLRAGVSCAEYQMRPRLNKIINTVIDVTYWSIISTAIIVYVLSCDRVNSPRNLNN